MAKECSEVPPELIKKWTAFFYFYDIDNDNFLSMKDFDIVRDNIANKARVSDETKAKLSTLSYDVWVIGMGADRNARLSLKDVLTRLTKLFKEGTFEGIVTKYRTSLFECMDSNNDGFINLNEFMKFADCFGYSNTLYQDEAFETIDTDSTGFLKLEEYLKAYVDYFIDPKVTLDGCALFGKSMK